MVASLNRVSCRFSKTSSTKSAPKAGSPGKARRPAADLIAHYQGGLRGEELFDAVASKKSGPVPAPLGIP